MQIIMNRRQFLLLAAGTVTLTGCQTVNDSERAVLPAQDREVNAGPASQYTQDGVFANFRDQGFFLVRQGGVLEAVSSLCTHKKCKLKAEPDHSFYCPCHGSTFTPAGKVTRGPARRDLPVFTTSIDETGQLLVRVPVTWPRS